MVDYAPRRRMAISVKGMGIMKAEDTLMTQYEKDSVLKLYLKEHPQYKGLNLWRPIARHQAVISFNAGKREAVIEWGDYLVAGGKKAGMKEVFDFLHDNSAGIMMNEYALEAKMKEWGIK